MEHRLIAVIDTNLFISGLFGRNTTTAELQELWIRQQFQLGKKRSQNLGTPLTGDVRNRKRNLHDCVFMRERIVNNENIRGELWV